MKYLAAYMLCVLSGETNPPRSSVERVLSCVGARIDSERVDSLIAKFRGRDLNALISEGRELQLTGAASTSGASSSTTTSDPVDVPGLKWRTTQYELLARALCDMPYDVVRVIASYVPVDFELRWEWLRPALALFPSNTGFDESLAAATDSEKCDWRYESFSAGKWAFYFRYAGDYKRVSGHVHRAFRPCEVSALAAEFDRFIDYGQPVPGDAEPEPAERVQASTTSLAEAQAAARERKRAARRAQLDFVIAQITSLCHDHHTVLEKTTAKHTSEVMYRVKPPPLPTGCDEPTPLALWFEFSYTPPEVDWYFE